MVVRKQLFISIIKHIVPAIAGTMLFFSCKTDIEMINALTEREQVPTMVTKNTETIYTENGIVKYRIKAPES